MQLAIDVRERRVVADMVAKGVGIGDPLRQFDWRDV
jgi:hypothetical protein